MTISLTPCSAAATSHQRLTTPTTQRVTAKPQSLPRTQTSEDSGLSKFLTALVNALRIYV